MRIPGHSHIVQVFGSGTDAGKTILSTLVARCLARQSNTTVEYLKPIQTGSITDYDHVNAFARIPASALYTYKKPASPDLAASEVSPLQVLATFKI